jgi:O-antigen/teichoic acid export membrane protein
MIGNASALIGTTAVNSAMGVIYWWLAAQSFSRADVGLASAAIAAMVLVGTIGMLGLGTLLITEIARQPSHAGRLISAALLAVAAAATVLGLIFAVLAAWLAPEFRPLAAGLFTPLIFAIGAGLTAATLVLDHAVVGLLWGDLQFWRNTLFSAAKLGLLGVAGIWLAHGGGMAIYSTWLVGNLLSIFVVLFFALRRGVHHLEHPDWGLLHRLGRTAIWHHGFNLALLAPGLLLPLVVTALLSAEVNASFYLAWMLVGFVFVVPTTLTTILHAIGAANRTALARETQKTLLLSLLGVLLAGAILGIAAEWVLGLFGASYANQAAGCLRILCLSGIPAIIKVHYIAIRRARDELRAALPLMVASGLLELGLATLGASLAGLLGLSIGWMVAALIQAAWMGSTVYQAAGYALPERKLL